MEWVWSNLPEIWGYTADHLGLSVPPIIIGFVLSIPLGYWASRSRITRSIILSVFSVLYTLPSLVLFVLVPVALGTPILDPRNVIIALAIYAVAIMVRSATDAFVAVSSDVRESARAVGFSGSQRFWRVELPLAGPVLLAGVRIVSVSTVSLATVGAFIGIPSLGNLFTDAFGRQIPVEAWTGVVCVLLIALVFDVIITRIVAVLMPWNRRASSNRIARRARPEVTA
jgi:osmoprotectant transport system permease protein